MNARQLIIDGKPVGEVTGYRTAIVDDDGNDVDLIITKKS